MCWQGHFSSLGHRCRLISVLRRENASRSFHDCSWRCAAVPRNTIRHGVLIVSCKMKIVSNLLFAITVTIFVDPTAAIFNGVPDGDGKEAKYPAVGAIMFRDDSDPNAVEWIPDCTGTLIAADKVLTAAHCVDLDPIDGEPRLGRISFSLRSNPDLSSCKDCIKIAKVDLDPRWDPVNFFAAADTGDLAIVHLSKRVKGRVSTLGFGSLSNPSPTQQELFTVVGYGASEDPDGNPTSFQFLDVRMITDDNKYQNLNSVYLTTSQAGAENYGGICFGDAVSGTTSFHVWFSYRKAIILSPYCRHAVLVFVGCCYSAYRERRNEEYCGSCLRRAPQLCFHF